MLGREKEKTIEELKYTSYMLKYFEKSDILGITPWVQDHEGYVTEQ